MAGEASPRDYGAATPSEARSAVEDAGAAAEWVGGRRAAAAAAARPRARPDWAAALLVAAVASGRGGAAAHPGAAAALFKRGGGAGVGGDVGDSQGGRLGASAGERAGGGGGGAAHRRATESSAMETKRHETQQAGELPDLSALRAPRTGEPPHILFVLVDDMGWNDIGYQSTDLGHATPTLDRFAADGVKLDWYYTMPSCTPARASVMTGKLAAKAGMGYDGPGRAAL